MEYVSNTGLPPIPILDLSRQYKTVGEEISRAIADVTSAGRFILGREVTEFETAVAAHTHATASVGCASGTDALWLAMAALGIGPGDAVVTTPFSFFATASSILRVGAKPVFADIDPISFNVSPQAVYVACIRNSTIRAILPVHLYGQCCDWEALTSVANRANAMLIEDAAQAFGASWQGKPAGALGNAAAFSFYPTKNLSAWGDAGLTTFNAGDRGITGEAVAERARALRAHGMRRRYYHDEVGWNSRLDTVQAAVLLVKLRYIAQWNEDRRTVAARYNTLFAQTSLLGKVEDNGIVLPTADPRGTHVWHQYVIRTPRRDELRAHLAAAGIGSEIYYPVPLHLQDALKDLGYKQGQFPVSERAANEVLALPIYPELREDEQQRIVETIATFFR